MLSATSTCKGGGERKLLLVLYVEALLTNKLEHQKALDFMLVAASPLQFPSHRLRFLLRHLSTVPQEERPDLVRQTL
jgi:hypothetical protein